MMNILTDWRVTEIEALVIVSILGMGMTAVTCIYVVNHILHALHQLKTDHMNRRSECYRLKEALNAKADPLPLQSAAAKWLEANWGTGNPVKIHIVHELRQPLHAAPENHPVESDRNSRAGNAAATDGSNPNLTLPKPETIIAQLNK